jgi:hypothetical protein
MSEKYFHKPDELKNDIGNVSDKKIIKADKEEQKKGITKTKKQPTREPAAIIGIVALAAMGLLVVTVIMMTILNKNNEKVQEKAHENTSEAITESFADSSDSKSNDFNDSDKSNSSTETLTESVTGNNTALSVQKTTRESSKDINPEDVDFSDADDYFENYSEVLSVEKASNSKDVFSEKESISELASRGFSDFDIVTHYSMGGDYYDEEQVVADDSSDKHPMYETYYCNSSGELWMIYIVNDTVMANPLNYNIEADFTSQVLICEKNSIMSYDCESNSFYETIPYGSELTILNAGKINSDLLDQLKVDKLYEYMGN